MNNFLEIFKTEINYIKPLIDSEKINDNGTYYIYLIDKDNKILIIDDNNVFITRIKISGLYFDVLSDIINNKNSLFHYNIQISKHATQSYYGIYDYIFAILSIYLDVEILNKQILDKTIFQNLILNRVLNDYIKKTANFNDTFWKVNRTNTLNEQLTQPDLMKCKLYKYQLKSLNWMKNIEDNSLNNINYNIQTSYPISNIINKLENKNLFYNLMTNKLESKLIEKKIKIKGGILADEMGLGKTIVCIGLILANQKKNNKHQKKKNKKYDSNATLIICPSHLVKQWEKEIKKIAPSLKIVTILNKISHEKLVFNDFINNDVILVSIQFLINFNYYIKLNYKQASPANINFDDRYESLMSNLNELQEKALKEQLNTKLPIFEYFNWHRIIIDEAHEIFGSYRTYHASICKYLKNFVSSLDSTFYWYVSGTPFINNIGFVSALNYVDLNIVNDFTTKYLNNNKLSTIKKEIIIPYTDIYKYNNINIDFNDRILDIVMHRNTQESVKNEINIPPVLEEIILVELSDIERNIYDSKLKYCCSEIVLRQICCHPLICDKEREILGSIEDLSEVKDKLLIYHNNIIKSYNKKIDALDVNNQAYNMVKKNFKDKINESKYLLNLFKNMDDNIELEDAEVCCICMDNITQLVITSCGHFYCKECIFNSIKYKKQCPLCKKDLDYKNIFSIDPEKDLDSKNILVTKYGAKMGKLIELCKNITNNKDNRIIIFSQWDRLLHLIGTTLDKNTIKNVYVKGNVFQKNKAIDSFKNTKNNKKSKSVQIIMLSLEHAASGTNLTEATHIIFTDPITGTNEKIAAIENQAIGRAFRLGQTNQVKVIKLITKNTIEEEIYNKTISPS